MAINFRRIWSGLNLFPKTTSTANEKGDLEVIDASGKLNYHNGTTLSPITTESHTATLTNKTVDADTNTISNLEVDNLKAGVLDTDLSAVAATDTTIPSAKATKTYADSVGTGAQTNLDAHINDTTDAHDASAISSVASGNLAATDVQTALDELQTDVDTRATQTSLDAHINDTTDAHDASAISVTPAGNLAATDAQAALVELQTDVDTRATSAALTAHTGASTNVHGVTGAVVGTTDTQTITNKTIDSDSNTITNIVDADIKSTAAIQRLKLQTGTANTMVKNSNLGIMTDAAGVTHDGTTGSFKLSVDNHLETEAFVNSTSSGSDVTLPAFQTGQIELTNAALVSIANIPAGGNGQQLTLINRTGNTISLKDSASVIGTAVNRIHTGTATTLEMADNSGLDLKYDSTEQRWQVIGGVGGGASAGGTLSTAFQLTGTELVGTWTTGKNATFLGGGTLAGTLAISATTPLHGDFSYRYTQAAGSLNDYFTSPVQDIDLRFRGVEAYLGFSYTYDGAPRDIKAIVYDVTNGAILSSSTDTVGGTSASTGSKAYATVKVQVPSTCLQIGIGFQVLTVNSGKIFNFDDINFGTNVDQLQKNNLVNYIENFGASDGTEGWATYSDTPAASPVNGAGTNLTSITFAKTTSSPIRGTSSFLFTKTAANLQGQGIAYDFNIDAADKGKVLQGSFEYQIASGTFADDTMVVYIYDKTNARLIQPAPYLIKNSGIIEKFPFEFQTSIDSTSYRLILHVSSTSASAYTIKFDNFSVGSNPKFYGRGTTDYTAVVSSAGAVTTTGPSFIQSIAKNGTGDYTITFVSGVFTVAPSVKLTPMLTGGATGFVSIVNAVTTSSFRFRSNQADAGGTTHTLTDMEIHITASKQGVDFSSAASSQIASHDASTNVVSFRAGGASTVIATGSVPVTIINPTIAHDTVGGYNATTGEYTIKVPGKYRATAQAAALAIAAASPNNSTEIYIKKNAGYPCVKQIHANSTTSRAIYNSVESTFDAVAGDVILMQVGQNFGSSMTMGGAVAEVFFCLDLISGPSQIMASDSVSALYTGAPPTGTINGSFNTTTFGTKVKDSHNAYASGVYTIPVSGTYDISTQVLVNSTLVANQLVQLGISINGTAPTYKNFYNAASTVNSAIVPLNVRSIPLLAGQAISIQTLTEGSTNSFSSSAGLSFFSITRTGNY